MNEAAKSFYWGAAGMLLISVITSSLSENGLANFGTISTHGDELGTISTVFCYMSIVPLTTGAAVQLLFED